MLQFRVSREISGRKLKDTFNYFQLLKNNIHTNSQIVIGYCNLNHFLLIFIVIIGRNISEISKRNKAKRRERKEL